MHGSSQEQHTFHLQMSGPNSLQLSISARALGAVQDARALHVRADELQTQLADKAAQVKDLQQSLTDCQQELGDLQRRHSRALRSQGDQSQHLAELQHGWQQQMQEAAARQEQGTQQVHICLTVQDVFWPMQLQHKQGAVWCCLQQQ